MSEIVAFEGSSFSGKSTMCKQTSSLLDVPVIDEFYEYAARAESGGFPPFARNASELDDRIDYFLAIEKERKADVDALPTPFALVDRTAATLVAFQRAMSKSPEGLGFHWDAERMTQAIQSAGRAGQIIVPRRVVVLSPVVNTSIIGEFYSAGMWALLRR